MATFPVNRTLLNGPVANIILSPAMSGTTFICTPSAAADRTVTLPSPAVPGLLYRFIHGATVAHVIGIVSPTATSMFGFWRADDGTATSNAGGGSTRISFLAVGLPGDYIEVRSDGVAWYVEANTAVAAGMAFA